MKKIISMALICAILFSAGLTSNINAAESTKSTESKLKANQSEQKEVREKTIAITVSDDYGAHDIAHQDIINVDDILINKTREILCNDDQ